MAQDGLKLAQYGRKLSSRWPSDGSKFASRSLQAGPILILGPHLRSKKPQDDRRLSQTFAKVAHDGPKVVQGGRTTVADGFRRLEYVST